MITLIAGCGGHSPIGEDTYNTLRQAVPRECATEDRFHADDFDELDEEYGSATLRCERTVGVIGSAAKFEVTRETVVVQIGVSQQTEADAGKSGRPAIYSGKNFYVLSCDVDLLQRTAKLVADNLDQPYVERYLDIPPRHDNMTCERNVNANDGLLYPTWATGPP